MKRSHIILGAICLLGTIFHTSFLHLNDVLKIADSFAYLQMSYFLQSFSQEGLGNGWFAFVYSLPIALFNFFIGDDFLSAKIVNLLLFNISAVLLWNVARKILSSAYSHLVVVLFFLSPTLLHFNIHVLSENIYIPLFLFLFLQTWRFIENISHVPSPSLLYREQIKQTIIMACILGLMYLTRAEAFIYLISIGLISFVLLIQKKLSFKYFFSLGIIFFVSFFIFIFPYLWHLESLTGEWGLTNKGASNLRQAELRGVEKMDNNGFEQAVAELTTDKHHLIAGFAGGMPYNRPQITGSLPSFIQKDPGVFVSRVFKNQKKLFTENIPEIFLGKAPKLFFSEDARFSKNYLFFLWCLFPLGIFLFGVWKIFQKQKVFSLISISFFLPALFFFTLFFTLNRYFLIFLPLILIIFCYALQHISQYKKIFSIFLALNYISVLLLSTLVYYNMESPKDNYYNLKQEAGTWLYTAYCNNIINNNCNTGLKIMERFPIVTYYAGSKTRYITPYTDTIQDIKEYGQYNNIDILVVDTMDFQTYRSQLLNTLTSTPEGFKKLKEFSNEKGQKVILYALKK